MIDLLPNIEQTQVGDSVGGFLAEKLPVERLLERNAAKRIPEKDLWAELSALGSFGLTTAEDHGGAGLTVAEEIMAFREYGRYLVSPTVLGTVLATHLASAAGDAKLVRDLVAGKQRAAVLNPLPGSKLGTAVSGAFQLFDGEPGDLLIAWDDHGAVLLSQEAVSSRNPLKCIDESVHLERLTITNARPLACRTTSDAPICLIAHLLLAASLTGIIEAVRDESVEYARTRVQFGNPIGVYQAVKHRCADMALWAEAAWSQTAWAALVLHSGDEDAAFQVTNAKMVAAEAAVDAARRAIQIYGGMGFTAEVDIHLFLKRAHLYGQLGGDSHRLSEKLLDLPLHV